MRGRLLDVPGKSVRPTQDRVRAAVFSSLLGYIAGARVLDLFAGTGAFGLEAISRGAGYALFVEDNSSVVACLDVNIRRLLPGGAGGAAGGSGRALQPDDLPCRIIRDDVGRFLKSYPVEHPFNLVFADPPYEDGEEWVKKILFHLSGRSILVKSGFCVIELSAQVPLIAAAGWNIVRERRYGQTKIMIYRLEGVNDNHE